MRKYYFTVVSALMLFYTVFGFRTNLFFDVGQESNRDPKFAIHGIFCLVT